MRGSGPLAMGLATSRCTSRRCSLRGWRGRERTAFVACDASVPHPGIPDVQDDGVVEFSRVARLGFAPAYGANFAPAAGAAAAAALYAAVRVADPNRDPRHTPPPHSAPAFAFSRNVWTNSIQSEVFALNNLFVAILLLARHARAVARRAPPRATRRVPRRAPLRCGDDQSAHLRARRRARRRRRLLPPADPSSHEPRHSPFSYSRPYRTRAVRVRGFRVRSRRWRTSPPGSWGATHEAAGFATHVTRAEYGTFRLYSAPIAATIARALGTYRYAMNLTETGGLAAPPAAAAAAAAMGMGTGTGMGTGMGKSITPPGGIRRAWVAYLAYTLGFQRMANLPIERDCTSRRSQVLDAERRHRGVSRGRGVSAPRARLGRGEGRRRRSTDDAAAKVKATKAL